MAIQPSRKAVAPVAQALVQLTTGMLQGALPRHGLADIAAVERLDVLDADPAVIEGEQRSLGREIDDRSLRIAAESDHVDADHVHIGHERSPSGTKKCAT
jgi:hypothetical protein